VTINHHIMATLQKTLSNRGQNKRSCPDSGSSGGSEDELVLEQFPRWLIIQGTDDSKPLNNVSPFVIGKSLKAQVGTLDTVKRLQRGDLLVQTNKKAYIDLLLGMTSLGNIPVKVSPHRTLNSSKGVVRSRDLARCSKEEILSGLSSQGVTDAVIISVKSGNERRITNTVILTFNLSQPPQHIKAGYLRIPVAVYIPNPLRCYKCQKFGHGSSHCKGELTCARCGGIGHDYEECQKTEHCVNCGGNHAASSKSCPKWKLEQRVQQIRAEKNISFIDARKLAFAEQKTLAQSTLASIVSSRVQPRESKSESKSVEVQTDLTWPRTADHPVQVSQFQMSKITITASTSTSTYQDVGSAEERAKKDGKSKSGQPRLNRPPPTQPPPPVTDTNRYAVLGSSSMEEGESSSSVIK